MIHLLFVSLLWAFSFGLIKGRLAGVDPDLASALRLALSFLLFLPFLRVRSLRARDALLLAAIGALQFGVMYLAYFRAFRHLAAHEVAILTVTTPLFVTLLDGAASRRLVLRWHAGAALAVAGAAIVLVGRGVGRPTLIGALLVQVSNLAFATGQVLWCRYRARPGARPDHEVFAIACAGAALTALLAVLPRTGAIRFALTGGEWLVLLYLGLVASGIGFFLWNVGATRVRPGTLAVLNNLKIPLAVLVSLLVFGETADLPRLATGGALLLAGLLLVSRPVQRPEGSALTDRPPAHS
jgi:drug/metabolite transporter (DMT)-like permease